MHVLAIPSWYPTSRQPTSGRYLREQFGALRKRGVQVGVIYPEHTSLRHLSLAALREAHFQRTRTEEEGIPIYRTHGWNMALRTPFRFIWLLREAKALARRYRKEKGRPDLIHAHSAQWAAAAARQLGKMWGIPYLVTEHFTGFQRGDLFRYEQMIARWGLQQASTILAVSSSLKETLIAQAYAPEDLIDVIPNPVDTEYFRPPSARTHKAPFRWITAASLNPRKGIDVLLHAFSRVLQKSSATLYIAGGGPQLAALRDLANELNISEWVHFLGPLSRQDVRAELWKSDAYVCSSRIETFGIPLIEAMATGLPVVSTDCGGPRDIVQPATGLLVPPENAPALADAMRSMQENAEDYDGVVIRRYIENQFSDAVICEKLIRQYQALSSPQ